MSSLARSFALCTLALCAPAFAWLGATFAQQMPATKVTPLMQQTLTDIPGREVLAVTIDIPPGGGSGRIAIPVTTSSATCWRAATASKSTTGQRRF
jgi:hypothetical protein